LIQKVAQVLEAIDDMTNTARRAVVARGGAPQVYEQRTLTFLPLILSL
jgi:hypothetical protein